MNSLTGFLLIFTGAAITLASCHRVVPEAVVNDTPVTGSQTINHTYWTDIKNPPPATNRNTPLPQPYRVLRLDLPELRQHLKTTGPDESKRVFIPLPDGRNLVYEVRKVEAAAQERASRQAPASVYRGTATADAAATLDAASTIRIELSRSGFKAMIVGSASNMVIEPYQPGDTLHYVSYIRRGQNPLRPRHGNRNAVPAEQEQK